MLDLSKTYTTLNYKPVKNLIWFKHPKNSKLDCIMGYVLVEKDNWISYKWNLEGKIFNSSMVIRSHVLDLIPVKQKKYFYVFKTKRAINKDYIFFTSNIFDSLSELKRHEVDKQKYYERNGNDFEIVKIFEFEED